MPGDHGAHGPFDDRSRESSWQLWANTHRGTLAAALGSVAAAALLAIAMRRG